MSGFQKGQKGKWRQWYSYCLFKPSGSCFCLEEQETTAVGDVTVAAYVCFYIFMIRCSSWWSEHRSLVLDDQVLLPTLASVGHSRNIGTAAYHGTGRGKMRSYSPARVKLMKINHNLPGTSSPGKLQVFTLTVEFYHGYTRQILPIPGETNSWNFAHCHLPNSPDLLSLTFWNSSF